MTEHDAAKEQRIDWQQLGASTRGARSSRVRYDPQFDAFKQHVKEATAPFRQFIGALDDALARMADGA